LGEKLKTCYLNDSMAQVSFDALKDYMRKLSTLTTALLVSCTALFGQQEKREITVLAGFAATGSEFIFWSDNTYGGNVQVIYELTKFGAGFSALGFKASGMFADGMTGGYGGLNLRVDEPFFVDLDVLLGYSSITNADLLSSYDEGLTEYKNMAFVTSLGLGYRFPESPLLLRIAYGIHLPFHSIGFNGALNFQLGYRF
jgi:hypothetical protein